MMIKEMKEFVTKIGLYWHIYGTLVNIYIDKPIEIRFKHLLNVTRIDVPIRKEINNILKDIK